MQHEEIINNTKEKFFNHFASLQNQYVEEIERLNQEIEEKNCEIKQVMFCVINFFSIFLISFLLKISKSLFS